MLCLFAAPWRAFEAAHAPTSACTNRLHTSHHHSCHTASPLRLTVKRAQRQRPPCDSSHGSEEPHLCHETSASAALQLKHQSGRERALNASSVKATSPTSAKVHRSNSNSKCGVGVNGKDREEEEESSHHDSGSQTLVTGHRPGVTVERQLSLRVMGCSQYTCHKKK